MLVAVAVLAGLAPVGHAALDNEPVEPAVILIEVTQQRADWYTPWQRSRPQESSGSGFLVSAGRVMTNAHVVSDARQIVVRRHLDSKPYFARIEFIAHDSDLALLRVDDPAFSEGVRPLKLGGLPSLLSHVRTYGYPAGGEKISRTEGVVSRIQFITYLHSGADSHLGVQTDSAINPGNSGGPVMQDGLVIGVAFQTNTRLNDVGYFIPAPVIRRFLADIEDGRYDGYGDLGLATGNMVNPTFRRYLKMESGKQGVVVERVQPASSAMGHVRPDDVILSVDGVPVFADGTIDYHDYALNFEQVVEEKLIGDTVRLALWRDGKPVQVSFLLKAHPNAANMRSVFDQQPGYVVFAGLVFMELNQEFMNTFGNYWENAESHLLYAHFFQERESSELMPGRVVLARVLPHRINSPYRSMANSLVTSINGRGIASLQDVAAALAEPKDGFQRFELEPGSTVLVLEAEQAQRAHPEIMSAYGISQDRRLP